MRVKLTNSGDVELLKEREARTLTLMALGNDEDDTPPPAAPVALRLPWSDGFEWEGAA